MKYKYILCQYKINKTRETHASNLHDYSSTKEKFRSAKKPEKNDRVTLKLDFD